MSENDIKARIDLLFACLQFDTEKVKMFTVGERIMINQERFQWMHILSYPTAEPRPVSIKIEATIKEAVRLIGVYDFEPFNTNILKDDNEGWQAPVYKSINDIVVDDPIILKPKK